MRELSGKLCREEFPQREKRQEIGAVVAKQEMRLVGRLLLRERPVARVGDRQRAGDHEHFGEASAVARREDHASDSRIDRQARELAPERRQRTLLVDGRELLQLLIAVGDRTRRRRLDKRECVDRGQAQRRHPQDHRGERRAQDLGFGVLRTRREVIFAVEPHADAGGDAAAATGALVRGRLRHLFHLQERRLVAQRITLDAREARIDDVANAGDGQRGFCDVGRKHDPPPGGRREDALLLGDGETRVQREDFERRTRTGGARVAYRAGARSREFRVRRAGTRECRPAVRATGPPPPRLSRLRAPPRRPLPRPPSSAGDSGFRPGNTRPETSMTGAGWPSDPKWRAKRSASSVAEVTITLRSGRRGRSSFRYPSRKSMLRLRSCASSTMIVS